MQSCQRKPENEICSATTHAENLPLRIQPHYQSRTDQFPVIFNLSFLCGPRRFIIKDLSTGGLNFRKYLKPPMFSLAVLGTHSQYFISRIWMTC